jgi:hypothetical protein
MDQRKLRRIIADWQREQENALKVKEQLFKQRILELRQRFLEQQRRLKQSLRHKHKYKFNFIWD